MKKNALSKSLAAVGIGVTLVVASAVPAHAITRPGCGDRTDLLKFHNGPHCYANRGTAVDRLTSQQTIGAGNNSGLFTTVGHRDTSFEHGWGTSLAAPQTVIVEHID